MSPKSVFQDLEDNVTVSDSYGVLSTLFTLRFLSVTLYRLAQQLGRRSPSVGSLIKQVNQLLTGADISWQAQIGPGLVLFHPVGVVIGAHVRVGSHCRLQQGVTLGGKGSRGRSHESPQIGDYVMFGAGARCIGSIRVGSGAVVGANAVVVKDVPAGHTALGVPAVSRPQQREP